jgi:hypothetical protein
MCHAINDMRDALIAHIDTVIPFSIKSPRLRTIRTMLDYGWLRFTPDRRSPSSGACANQQVRWSEINMRGLPAPKARRNSHDFDDNLAEDVAMDQLDRHERCPASVTAGVRRHFR